MGKITRFYIDRGRAIGAALDAIKGADELDLRVLAAALLMADGEGCVQISELETALEIEHADVTAAVKYWRGAGIFGSSGTARVTGGEPERNADAPEKKGSAVRRCAVESYSTDELAEVLERADRTGFIDASQAALGRIFNKNEVGKLIGIADQLGFEEEAVLAILSYCARIGRASLSYAEKVAITFHDEDAFSAEEVHARIDALLRRNDAIERIRRLYGFGGRALSATEKKLFTAWTEEYGFDFAIIERAYDITVDATHDAAPKYTNAILKKWHDNGLRTLADIEAFAEMEKQKAADAPSPRVKAQKGAKPMTEKQADVEDWFEQRLKQSFGD